MRCLAQLLPTVLGTHLELLHSSNVGRLDVVLEVLNTLLEVVKRHLVVLDDDGDLQLAHTVTDGNKLRSTPHKTVHFDSADGLLHGFEVGLVVPGLDLEGNDRLLDRLGLLGLARLVLLHALGLDALRLGVHLVLVRAEEVHLVVTARSRVELEELLSLGLVARQLLGIERLGVLVPAGNVGVLARVRSRRNLLDDGGVGLGGLVTIG